MMKYALALALLVGCEKNKPTEAECRAAITNLQRVIGTEHLREDITQKVRSCQNGSTRDEALCTANAKTLADVDACRAAAANK